MYVCILAEFKMGKFHKDIATAMTEAAQDPTKDDQTIIKVCMYVCVYMFLVCCIGQNAAQRCGDDSRGLSYIS